MQTGPEHSLDSHPAGHSLRSSCLGDFRPCCSRRGGGWSRGPRTCSGGGPLTCPVPSGRESQTEGPAQRDRSPAARRPRTLGQILWLPLVGHVPESALQFRCTSETENVSNPSSPRGVFPKHCCSAAHPAKLPHLRGPRSVLSAPWGLLLSHLCPSNTAVTWSWCSHLIEDRGQTK